MTINNRLKFWFHGWLRERFMYRVAKALYEESPIPEWDWKKFNENSQMGHPMAELHMNVIERRASAVIAALVWRK